MFMHHTKERSKYPEWNEKDGNAHNYVHRGWPWAGRAITVDVDGVLSLADDILVLGKHTGIPRRAAQILQSKDRLDHLRDNNLCVRRSRTHVEPGAIQVVRSLGPARVDGIRVGEVIRL